MGKTPTEFGFSARARRTKPPPITSLMAAGAHEGLISLAVGLVDYDTLPAKEVREVVDRLLADGPAARAALQYGTTEGLLPLREAILEHLAALDGVAAGRYGATGDDLLVTTGSQQLLFTLADILVDPGDVVITGWPDYFVYAGVLQALGAEVRCADLDEGGLVVESLEAVLARLEREGLLGRVKIVYVTSYHQNPTGLTLAEDRRAKVIEVVRRYSRAHRILLIEDAAYRELTYDASPPRSVKRFDEGNEFVALVGTFSKPFSPGLKTGYGLLPAPLLAAVLMQKGSQDFGSANFGQHLLLGAMRSGLYARHLDVLRARYARKRDAMLAALQEELGFLAPSGARWTRPSGGLYVWLTLPEGVDTGPRGRLIRAAEEEGVLYVPGEYCYGPDPTRQVPRSSMRLSFGVADESQIREGVARLARAVRSVARASCP